MKIAIKEYSNAENALQLLIGIVYIVGFVWWLFLYFMNSIDTSINYWFNIPMGFSPLMVGGVLCVASLRGSRRIFLNRYSLYFGLYLLLWGAATIGTLYYNIILQINAPFPSVLDWLYILSQIFLLIAIFGYLSVIRQWEYVKGIGQKILFFGTAPVIQLILYWYVMQVSNKEAFPGLNFQYISSMTSLALNIIIFIVLYIFAFIFYFQENKSLDTWLGWYLITGVTVQYIVDYYFIALLDSNTFYIGHFVDLMYMTLYFYMSFVGLQIYKRLKV